MENGAAGTWPARREAVHILDRHPGIVEGRLRRLEADLHRVAVEAPRLARGSDTRNGDAREWVAPIAAETAHT